VAASEYVMRQVDDLDAARGAERSKDERAQNRTIARYTQTVVDLNRQLTTAG
jgi:hypothetical protein